MPTKTDARLKYEASQRNQATMAQVEALLEKESAAVLAVGQTLDRQAMGAFLRQIVPTLIDKYGNVNAVAAMQYYDEQRLAWMSRMASSNGRKAERYAAAKLKSSIYLAKMPEFNAVEISDPIVGYSMAQFSQQGFDVMSKQVTSAMTRAVGSYNRDTILYNAGLDEAVVGVQRVAEPDACAFCTMMAFSSDKFGVRTAQYAIDFHDRCRCSIETLYIGDRPIVPPYYKKLEADYVNATKATDGPLTAKNVLAEMRVQTGRS